MNYAPMVRLPYDDLSGVIEVWSHACDAMAVFEHTPDQGCNATHVHMIMLGCKYKTAEPLKRLYYKMFPNADTSDGNGLWSWTNKEFPVPGIEFITYMSKGVLRPKFVKNISDAKVEELRGKWSEPTPRSSQTFIDKSSDKPKHTKYTLMLKVVNLILSKHTEATEERKKIILNDLTELEWVLAARKVVTEEKLMLGKYKFLDLIDACQMYYCKEKFVSEILYMLEKRRR